ncbi:hypothetical protein KUV73_21285 [Mameliella alba]|nr:hypothetical protein [Mameliella alba]MBY6171689.1 hypothetical protein [Mameliella alba]MBY6176914.1 hypothetical protein [Mameliella alba]
MEELGSEITLGGVPLQKAVIIWTPTHPPFEKFPTSGLVLVVEHPVADQFNEYLYSSGADGFGWKQAGQNEQLRRLSKLALQLVARDGIAPDKVVKALRTICELKNLTSIGEIVGSIRSS